MRRLQGIILPLCMVAMAACAPDVSEGGWPDWDGAEQAAQPLASAAPPIASEGEYLARLVFLAADSSWVESLLPPELELGPQHLTPPHRHPVGLLMQHYLDVHPPGNPSASASWSELTLYVLETQLKTGVDCVEGKQGPFAYLPIMFVNSLQAIAIGNPLFGLNQHFADMAQSASAYDVVSLDPTTPLEYAADIGPTEELTKKGRKRFNAIAEALSAPTLGRTPTGTIIWHKVNWGFPTADVRSIKTLQIDASSPDLGELHEHFRGINKSDLGGVRIQSTFTATGPAPCPNL
jgi:hypothetical protein